MMSSVRILTTLVTLLTFSSSSALAAPPKGSVKPPTLMEGSEDLGESRAAEFVMRKYPGERLIPVRMVGGVKNPGTYYVPQGTDLLTVLSLSGGLDPSSDSSKIIHTQWNNKLTKTLDLRQAMETPDKYNPSLEADDVLYVDQNKPIISNNTMLIVALVASALGIIVGAAALPKSF